MGRFEDRQMRLPDTCRYCKYCMPVRDDDGLNYYCMLDVSSADYKVVNREVELDGGYSNKFYDIMKMVDENLIHCSRHVLPFQSCQFFDGGDL